MCKNGFSRAFENSALDGHNDFRSLVARGLAKNGLYIGINAPVAANMMLLDYDCTGESFAYDHVKTCDKQLWAENERPNYEENIHILETNETSLSKSFVIQIAISTWASELEDSGIRLNMVFTPKVSQQKKKVTSVTKYYDCTAEYFALKHVKSCDKQHWADCNSPGYKENIHNLETNETSLNNSFVIHTAISTWASELKNNGIRLNMVFTPEVSRQKNKVTSVTKVEKLLNLQIMWGVNRNVGCATQECNGFYFTSCIYYNIVNTVGEDIYKIGASCNECLSKNECISLGGLCP
ncbi:hypothetical protein KIN20_021038 [Parelaphostrongylus tenuis]|uniref:SCP domain-containing protein n=1 Tax=Parelaphostrongylus tenuis TaxID=148309 RepID=A0AAD5MTL4_PARTN|nr:hypothetical protein KIN20_021038 [Parelaphostrongylus tenuis]